MIARWTFHDGVRMADHRAAHLNLPLVDRLPIFISKGDVRLYDDGACINHLHLTFHKAVGVTAIVKRVQETLSYLATPKAYSTLVQVNVITLLSAAFIIFTSIIAQEFLRDTALAQFIVQASTWTSFRTSSIILVATLSMMVIMIVGSWFDKGGPAWSVARLSMRWPFKAIHTPNGPRGWPILGTWWLMQGSNMHRDLAKHAWGGGDSTRKLMALSVGVTRIVLSSDPKVAKQILQSQVFGDRPLKQAASDLGFARAIGFAVQGPYWRHLRKIAVMHMFSHKQIVSNYESLQRETSRMISAIACDLSTDEVGTRVGLCLRPYLQRAAVNNITTTVFGRHYSFGSSCREATALEGMIREGFELLGGFNSADHLPLLRHLPFLPFASRCRNLTRQVRTFVQPILDEHRRRCRQGDSSVSSFVDVLLSLQGDQKLLDDDMISVLWEMVFRGTDTVAVLIEWALAEVILNPKIQAQIHKELDTVVGQTRLVQQKDIDQLPYLQAVLKETLRSHPPGPLLSWARIANEDTQVAGYHVPQGTTAMVNMWAITHDPTVWPNPNTFDPYRFMKNEGGDDIDVLGTDLRLAPFGSGRRVCPGRALGLATAQLWLARLLHQFSWSQDPDHPIQLTDNLKMSCEMALPLHACAMVRIPEL
ncbi:hypothetical protein M758_1G025500 [Ceratodon purpureus]|nr:hypothetical protein M758_1G025500 [Ceratodon purpureus]